MHPVKQFIYNKIRSIVKFYLKTFLEFKVWGKEHIPPGPKIFCSNHFSSSDPFFVITIMDEPVHMIIGPGFSVPLVRTILKAGEQINALPENRKHVIDSAVNYLSDGEAVYIFPEGELNDQVSLRTFYSGMARIYLNFPVPIIPIGIVSPRRYVKEKDVNIKVGETVHKTLTVLTGKYYANIGEPLTFPQFEGYEDKQDATRVITETVKERIDFLIQDIKTNKFWG